MARRAMVTRTVVGVEVSTMAVNTSTSEVHNNTFTLSGTWKDDGKVLKAIQKKYDTEDEKNVAIVSKKEVNKLYGMYEEDFIANAMELDEARKPINQTGETGEETAEVTVE